MTCFDGSWLSLGSKPKILISNGPWAALAGSFPLTAPLAGPQNPHPISTR